MVPIVFALCFLLAFSSAGGQTFEEQTIDNNISIGYGIALGDVDGDGKPDILLADKKQFVWYRNGDWKKFILAKDLTQHDNVCIAARDINGDGKVEIAVGAQWNPSETDDPNQSGSVHYLLRPDDPTQLWQPVRLPHEPTVHRMKWLSSRGKHYLIVLPLHGRGNRGGEGQGVNILAYSFPKDVNSKWRVDTLDKSMHLTHNFEIAPPGEKNGIYVAGKEGVRFIRESTAKDLKVNAEEVKGLQYSAGEVRKGQAANKKLIATIEPMHGERVVAYLMEDTVGRIVIDDNLKEGHALAVADLLGVGSDQVIAGWRLPDKNGLTGIKLYRNKDVSGHQWESQWIDKNGIACEDIQVMDLNADGKVDIVASGRATHNIKVYWNKTK